MVVAKTISFTAWKQTGKLLWKFEAQNYINGVPTIYDRKYVVFGGCDAMLYVIGLEDGKDVDPSKWAPIALL